MRLALVAVLTLIAASCLDSRDRLVPPRVYLRLDDTGVAAGGEMSGRLSAADERSITYVKAELEIAGDTAKPLVASASVFNRDTVDFDFRFTVKTGFPAGTKIFVTAFAIDDQNFEVSVTDTLLMR